MFQLQQAKDSNPFYGMKSALEFYQNASKGLTNFDLDRCFAEVETREQFLMLMSLIISVGDVPGRTPYGLGNVDNGGNAERDVFRDKVIPAVVRNLRNKSQIKAFAEAVVRYTAADNLYATRVKTSKVNRGKSNVMQVINMPEVWGIDVVADLTVKLMRGNSMERYLAAKWMIPPKRKSTHREITKELQTTRRELIQAVGERMDWTDSVSTWKEWRKDVIENLESYVFSSGDILKYDREQFIEFIQALPNDARDRVMRRLKNTEKYGDRIEWLNQWKEAKKAAQAEVRKLSQKVKEAEAMGQDTQVLVAELEKAKQQAKVNHGSTSTRNIFADLYAGKENVEMRLESFVETIELPFNFLVNVDGSGSMRQFRCGPDKDGWYGKGNNTGPVAADLAAFVATIFFRKNPDVESGQLIGTFDDGATFHTGVGSTMSARNSLMRGKTKKVSKPLYYPEKSLVENYEHLKSWLRSECTGGSTNIGSVAQTIADQMKHDPGVVEELMNYPVWIFISDGNFNNLGNATASLADMLKTCENKLGFRPYIVLMDVAGYGSQKITNFSGVDNVILVPGNPENLMMLLSNFADGMNFDIYTALNSIYESNRYAWIRDRFANFKWN